MLEAVSSLVERSLVVREERDEGETRYRMLSLSDPAEAKRLLDLAQGDVEQTWKRLQDMTRDGGSRQEGATGNAS